jgi:hypothetical protein
MEEECLTTDLTYSSITDTELDYVVEAIKELHPNDGERLMTGAHKIPWYSRP